MEFIHGARTVRARASAMEKAEARRSLQIATLSRVYARASRYHPRTLLASSSASSWMK